MSSSVRTRTMAKAQLQQSKAAEAPPQEADSEEKTKCAICLGDLVNKSYSNNCCHQFCFGCLREWSKVKAECPLCKCTFTSIYYNIRSISDYDEYHVPPIVQSPSIPMLNVPYLHQILEENDYVTMNLRSRRYHTYGPSPIPPAFPFHNHSFRGRGHHLNFRILEYVPFERHAEQPNPFRTGQPEYFGTSIGLHNNDPLPSTSSIPNYQARRRIYDRNQWVIPLGRTLPEGSVMFPSVEYIQTHPTARSRITTWLHREITVLLGLQMSMQEMATVFDVIMNVLENYDIRSREFRELVVSYFEYKTRHFQHEFYHFVLSGMGLEEYDRNACYSSNRSNSSSDPRDMSTPPVVTLGDSSDDEDNGPVPARDDNECIVIPPNDAGNSNTATSTSQAIISSAAAHIPELPWDLTVRSSMSELNQALERQLRSYQQMSSNLASTAERLRYGRDRHRRHHREMYERLAHRERRSRHYGIEPYERPVEDVTVGEMRFSCVLEPFRSGRLELPRDLSQASRQQSNNDVISLEQGEGASSSSNNAPNDDDCVLLGVHPVVKKPPLAVITISDSDEEAQNRNATTSHSTSARQESGSSRYKNEVFVPTEVPQPDQFLEMFYPDAPPSTASSAFPVTTINLSSSSPSPPPSSPSSSSVNHFNPPNYFLDPGTTVMFPMETVTSSSQRQPRGSPLVAHDAETTVITDNPTSSRRLRLLDSKKPKSSKHHKTGKTSGGSRKHRTSSSSRKKRRNRSPSSSTDDNRVTRSHKTGSKKSKKKKSKRLSSPATSSYSEDSDSSSLFSLSSVSSSSEYECKKLKKASKHGGDTKSKPRKSHKSKKSSNKHSRVKKSARRHHPKKLYRSKEYLSSMDSDNPESEKVPTLNSVIGHVSNPLNLCTVEPSTSSSSAVLLEESSLDPTLNDTSNFRQNVLLSSESNSHDDRNYNTIGASLQIDGLGDEIRNLVEAAASNAVIGHADPSSDHVNVLNTPEESRNDSDDWQISSSSPYLLNLSLSRMSDDFWS